MVWVRFVVTSSLTHWGERHTSSTTTSHLEYVIGCRHDGTPRCAALGPVSRFEDNAIAISGAVATSRYTDLDGKAHVDRVTFKSP
jgi:hypothetical protein